MKPTALRREGSKSCGLSVDGTVIVTIVHAAFLRSSRILAYLNSLAAEAGFQTPLSGTSLRVTKNHEAHWHQHDDNTGLQYMTTLGDFAGGETFIVEEEGQEVMELKQAVEGLGLAGQKIRGQRKDARRRIITFHGRKLHCTCPFLDTDERYAITLFSSSARARLLGRGSARHPNPKTSDPKAQTRNGSRFPPITPSSRVGNLLTFFGLYSPLILNQRLTFSFPKVAGLSF